MPSIEITAEQAAALARGENINIKPAEAETEYYVVVMQVGAIYEIETLNGKPVRYRRLRNGVVPPMCAVPARVWASRQFMLEWCSRAISGENRFVVACTKVRKEARDV